MYNKKNKKARYNLLQATSTTLSHFQSQHIQKINSNPQGVLIAGIVCGLPCLFSAIGQAKTAASCIKSINNEQMEQGQALLATGVPELYALTGLAGAFLVLV